MSKTIIKCPQCHTNYKAMSGETWMCRPCGITVPVPENQRSLWKLAYNHGGKQ